jgi:hypothetical protein
MPILAIRFNIVKGFPFIERILYYKKFA